MQNYKKTAFGFVPDTKTPEEYMLTGKEPRNVQYPKKITVDQMKYELRDIANKIGAKVQKMYDITAGGECIQFIAEVALDGDDMREWHYPLVCGTKGLKTQMCIGDSLVF